MSLPKQVLEAQKRGDEAIAEFKKLNGVEEDAVETEVVEEDIVEVNSIPSEDADDLSFLTESEDEVEETTEQQEDTVAETQVASQPNIDELLARAEKSEAQYNTLKGKYNKETRELRDALGLSNNELSELKGKVDAMIQMQTQPQTQQETDPFSFLSEDQREEFGEDTLAMVRDIADRTAQAKNAELMQKIQELESKQTQTMESSEQDKYAREQKELAQEFERRLTSLVPEWETLNEDSKFIKWLDDTKDVYGQSYMDGLNNTWDAGNIDGTAAIFNLYKRGIEGEDKQESVKQTVTSSQISPPKNASNATPRVQKSNVMNYKVDEISNFRRQTHLFEQGKAEFRGKRLSAGEAEKLSKDMAQAYIDGRIQA